MTNPKIKSGIGYAIAAACLIWVLHDVRLEELWKSIGKMQWRWVGLAILSDSVAYLSQGKRWALLVRHIGKLKLLKATQAVYAGLFVSDVLPLRAGEVVRAWLGAKWLDTEMTRVLPTVLTERLFDAIWLALAVGVTLFLVPLPEFLMEAEAVLAVLILVATGLFVYMALRKQRPTGRRPGRLRRLLDRTSSGIAEIGHSKWLYASFVVSALFLILQILAFWLVMWAYGIQVSIWRGAAVLVIVRLGTIIPGAPANLGTYQFFAVVGLTIFGVNKTTATGFSVVVFLILTIPVWLIGSLAFAHAGLKLKDVHLL